MTSRKRSYQAHPPPSRRVTLTLAQSIDFARSLLAKGELAPAENVLATILAARPEEPDALHLIGALRNLQGRSAEALPLLEKAIELAPDEPGRWNDIGIIYARLSREADAMAAYQRSAELAGDRPMAARAHENIGRMHMAEDLQAAERSFRRAIEVSPEFGLAWYGLSEVLIKQNRVAEGMDAWGRATVLMPKSASREHVARALIQIGRTEEAIAHYRQWLREDPKNPVIKHHLAALTQPDTAERASDAYVETVFDWFANSFDSKLKLLDYRGPELIVDALRVLYPDPTATLDIADAGCGTGLCGPLVLPWARRLCGFDLSGGMLARAEARKVYSDLHKFELVSFLNGHPGEFDVVISADTLIYFGSLNEVLVAARQAVRPGGHILFTLEASDDDTHPHLLRPSGRFAHSLAYVVTAATRAELLVFSVTRITARTESGRPVIGWLITLGRP